jgi:hypothetical protein
MMDAPTPVSDKQLKELGIAVVVPKWATAGSYLCNFSYSVGDKRDH